MNIDYYLPMVEPLIDREMEVLHLTAMGLSNREIASELVLTLGRVKWYNKQTYSKLGVHSRTQPVDQIEIDRYQDEFLARLDERTVKKAWVKGGRCH